MLFSKRAKCSSCSSFAALGTQLALPSGLRDLGGSHRARDETNTEPANSDETKAKKHLTALWPFGSKHDGAFIFPNS